MLSFGKDGRIRRVAHGEGVILMWRHFLPAEQLTSKKHKLFSAERIVSSNASFIFILNRSLLAHAFKNGLTNCLKFAQNYSFLKII